MADYNLELSQLHQRVWQEEFGLPATIDEDGWIQFGDTPLGELSVILREYSQEGMKLECVIFEDVSGNAPPLDVLLRLCNNVNGFEDAKVAVNDSGTVVRASLYLVLDAKGTIPDEGLLGAVALPAISRIKAAKAMFLEELNKVSH